MKNYKVESLAADDEDEEKKTESSESTPYGIESFRDLLNEVVRTFLVHNASSSETSIAVLSILNNLDCRQWR